MSKAYKPVSVFRIRLPMPPSLNTAYYNVPRKGRVKTDEYSRWCNVVGLMLNRHKSEALPKGPWGCVIGLQINHNSDIDNRIKPILDALVAAGMTPDDCWCDHVSADREPIVDGLASVEVWSIAGERT